MNASLSISYPNQPRHGAQRTRSSDTEEAGDHKEFEVFHADGFDQKVRLDSDRGISLRDLRVGALCYSVTQRFSSLECEISRPQLKLDGE